MKHSEPFVDQIPVFETVQTGNIDVWMAACGTIFSASPLDHQETDQYIAKTWFIDPIMVGFSQYHSMVSKHAEGHIQDSGGHMNVHRYVTNEKVALDSDGIPLLFKRGSIGLLDYSRPFTTIHPDSECHSFIIPHGAVGYAPSDRPHAMLLPSNSIIEHLIGREMDAILEQLQRGATSISRQDIQRFLGCVEMALSPEQARQSAREHARDSLKRAIIKYIDRHLASPSLSVSWILNNFGLSRASLYRMFEQEDGVRAFISHRRLHRAVIDLAASPNQRGQIHRVSERWGFTSDASFNRSVRREFGLAPGSLFQMPIQASPPSKSTTIMHDLLQDAARRQLQPA